MTLAQAVSFSHLFWFDCGNQIDGDLSVGRWFRNGESATMDEQILRAANADFVEGLQSLGYEPSDFVIENRTRTDFDFGEDGVPAAQEEIHVSRPNRGRWRVYDAANGRPWALLALRDVKLGVFGPK